MGGGESEREIDIELTWVESGKPTIDGNFFNGIHQEGIHVDVGASPIIGDNEYEGASNAKIGNAHINPSDLLEQEKKWIEHDRLKNLYSLPKEQSHE